ncbi:MAG: hypothetical protein EPN36_15395 [Rhodanobacteraceae bacterium]|nr:MAG: hypothetical protein EPN36_15395 [Rhodanobacteraceae bacterium]
MQPTRLQDPLTLAAGTWLACGLVLYGLTPLPLHDPTLGWSAAFWLLVAPTTVLLARYLCRSAVTTAPTRSRVRRVRTTAQARRVHRPSRTPTPALTLHAATPLRLASIRRSNSRMMR